MLKTINSLLKKVISKSKDLHYWDYIKLEKLISLQQTRTTYPDEHVFITFHQICELYFKLIIKELEMLCDDTNYEFEFWQEKLNRLIRYMDIVTDSFSVMISGLKKSEFIEFRKILFPSSGFQSYQFRVIEILSTNLKNLCHCEKNINELKLLYPNIYWKQGSLDFATGEKTSCLINFEKKYDGIIFKLAEKYSEKNLAAKIAHMPYELRENNIIQHLLSTYDTCVNLKWRNRHLFIAQAQLSDPSGSPVASTGGTNWLEYLPPEKQQIRFFA